MAPPETKNELQCTRCQEFFDNKENWGNHDINADCPIRCPECNAVFQTKSDRQTHTQEQHNKTAAPSEIIEINSNQERQMTDKLKEFTETRARRRTERPSSGESAADNPIRAWIDHNTATYRIGRGARANATQDLGHWFIMFSVTFANVTVPDHPCMTTGLALSTDRMEKS